MKIRELIPAGNCLSLNLILICKSFISTYGCTRLRTRRLADWTGEDDLKPDWLGKETNWYAGSSEEGDIWSQVVGNFITRWNFLAL